MERLRANPSHPTSKKIERIIGLLENVKLDLYWFNGKLRVRDNEFGVSFDLIDESENTSLTEMPPLAAYKLTRDKKINKYCECRYCNPDFDKGE